MQAKQLRLISALVFMAALTVARSAAADVPLDVAVEAAQAAINACRSNGYRVTVVILDTDYATRVVLRDAEAAAPTVEIGRRKAYTVVKTGMSSGDFGKTVPGQGPPPAPGAAPPPIPGPINGDASLIPWAGGLPIMSGGKLVGAMSASGAPGGDKDEACVRAGLSVIAARLR